MDCMDPDVSLEPLDVNNWLKVCRLSVSEEQKAVFTVPNVYWIGISRYEEHSELFAVRAGGEYVGLIGARYDKGTGAGQINPLMIDQHYQRKGYGRAALLRMIAWMRENYGVSRFDISNRTANAATAKLYEPLGFHVYALEGGEELRKLELPPRSGDIA